MNTLSTNDHLDRPRILVTGGAGYIGSHTVIELWNAGYEPVIVDNFSNSDPGNVDRISSIIGRRITHHTVDCCDASALAGVIRQRGDLLGVIHFAAFKSVSGSLAEPERYMHNNMRSLQNVVELVEEFHIPSLVFSSSCTVYGQPDAVAVTEETPWKAATSPYGATKQLGEQFIRKHMPTGAIMLRYFNPVGAHPSGLIGEIPDGPPSNLVPCMTQAAMGLRDKLIVHGTDHDTPDGSCIRDFIHVRDLATAHVAALARLTHARDTDVFNVGTGRGISVLEAVSRFMKVNEVGFPVKLSERRPGDIDRIQADVSKAARLLRWQPRHTFDDAMRDAWRWEIRLRHLEQRA
jgi:UDP-glucose 4-epimerase